MKSTNELTTIQSRIYRETQEAGGHARRLIPWLLDRRNLDAAWQRVRTAAGANTPGPDGVSCADLQGRSARWLAELADRLLHGT